MKGVKNNVNLCPNTRKLEGGRTLERIPRVGDDRKRADHLVGEIAVLERGTSAAPREISSARSLTAVIFCSFNRSTIAKTPRLSLRPTKKLRRSLMALR